MWRSLLLLLVACGGAADPGEPAITPVGAVMGTPVTQSVGPAGGEVVSADGRLTVSVPAGALAAATPISIQPITNQLPEGIGLAYRLGPEGTTFATPVTLSFHLDDAALLGTTPALLRIAYQAGEGSWRPTAVTVDGGTISTTTPHFSDWGVMPGARLSPGSQSVEIDQTVPLTVISCPIVEVAADGGQALAGCDSRGLSPERWTVNGVEGGNATLGTIGGSGAAATFRAPHAAPRPPTVQIATELPQPNGGKAILFARVLIIERGVARWGGESMATEVLDDRPDAVQWNAEAQFTFLLSSNAPQHSMFLSGTVTVTRLPPAPPGPNDCTVTVEPSTQTLDLTSPNTSGGVLIATDPALYTGVGAIVFFTTQTVHCPNQPDYTTPSTESAVFLLTGPLAPYDGGPSISGSFAEDGGSWQYHFYQLSD